MTLNMKDMSVMELNRNAILTHFGLQNDQLKLFVALAGGLYSSKENVQVICFLRLMHYNYLILTLNYLY